MKASKTRWRVELVRVGRSNGWARVAIVKEDGAKCFVVMREMRAFGSLQAAKEYIAREQAQEKPEVPR